MSAQIAYTQLSSRWYYPDWYYSWSRTYTNSSTGEKVTVEVLMIDTVILLAAFETNDTVVGPPPEQQWEWLNKSMAASTADYLWVGGHFPVWSGCSHGPTPELVERLRPLLTLHQAHYMSGHDHCSSFHDEGHGPVYVVAGNGDNCCYQSKNAEKLPPNTTKFAYWTGECPVGATHCPRPDQNENRTAFAAFHFGVEGMAVQYVDSAGLVLYTSPALPRRAKANV